MRFHFQSRSHYFIYGCTYFYHSLVFGLLDISLPFLRRSDHLCKLCVWFSSFFPQILGISFLPFCLLCFILLMCYVLSLIATLLVICLPACFLLTLLRCFLAFLLLGFFIHQIQFLQLACLPSRFLSMSGVLASCFASFVAFLLAFLPFADRPLAFWNPQWCLD